jgi:hypothetical protein
MPFLCGYTAVILGSYINIKDGSSIWQMPVLEFVMHSWLLPMEVACLAALSFLGSSLPRIVLVCRMYFQWTFEFRFLRSVIYRSGSLEGLCVEIVTISHWHFSGPYTSQLIKSVYLNVKLTTDQHYDVLWLNVAVNFLHSCFILWKSQVEFWYGD